MEVHTADLCFLAALHLHADRAAVASFEEDQLVDLFVQVCDAVDPGAENPRKRATHATGAWWRGASSSNGWGA